MGNKKFREAVRVGIDRAFRSAKRNTNRKVNREAAATATAPPVESSILVAFSPVGAAMTALLLNVTANNVGAVHQRAVLVYGWTALIVFWSCTSAWSFLKRANSKWRILGCSALLLWAGAVYVGMDYGWYWIHPGGPRVLVQLLVSNDNIAAGADISILNEAHARSVDFVRTFALPPISDARVARGSQFVEITKRGTEFITVEATDLPSGFQAIVEVQFADSKKLTSPQVWAREFGYDGGEVFWLEIGKEKRVR